MLNLLATLSALFLLVLPTAQAQTWSRIVTAGLTNRMSPNVTSIDGKIYVIGGIDPKNTSVSLQTIDVYDPSTDRWETLRPATDFFPKFWSPTWAYKGKIYSYSEQSIIEYDPVTNSFTAPIALGDIPSALAGVEVVVARGKAYFIGDNGSGASNTIYYLDIETLTWGSVQTYGNYNSGIGPTLFADDEKIYVLPGTMIDPPASISVLDLDEQSWSTFPTEFGLLHVGAGVKVDNKFIVLGHPGTPLSTMKTLVFDPVTNKFDELILERPTAQATSYGAMAFNGNVYSIGSGHEGTDRALTLEMLTFASASVETSNDKHVSVYPNPATDVLHLETTASNISITDASGRVVYKLPEAALLNVSALTAGVYTLAYEVGRKTIRSKFLKQ